VRADRGSGEGEDSLVPNLVIPGAQKAGTTTLFDLLSDHPDVEGVEGKEVHVFSLRCWREGLERFQGGFSGRARYRLDASTSYLFIPEALRRLHEVASDELRIVVVLRDPVSRARSAYYQVAKQKVYGTLRWYEDRPLAECLAVEAGSPEELRAVEEEGIVRARDAGRIEPGAYDAFQEPFWPFRYLANGLYAERLALLLELFDREQMLFLDHQQLREDPRGVRRMLAGFLGLPDLDGDEPLPRSNPTTVPRKGGPWGWIHYGYPYLRDLFGTRRLDGLYQRVAWRRPPGEAAPVTASVRDVFRADLDRVRELVDLQLRLEES
jgi:hypothetical protein